MIIQSSRGPEGLEVLHEDISGRIYEEILRHSTAAEAIHAIALISSLARNKRKCKLLFTHAEDENSLHSLSILPVKGEKA